MARKLTDYKELLQQFNPEGRIRAYHVASALYHRHTSKQSADIFFEQVKTGSTFLGKPRIIDAVAVRPSWSTPCITGYEIKVERGDFLRDEKWREYLEYTNEFYFAAPAGIIDEEELPVEVGLVIFNPKTKKVRTVRKAAWREIRRDIAFDLLYYLVLWRSEDRKGYTNQERIEQYLSGKLEGKELAYRFQSKMTEELNKANEQANTYKSKFDRFEQHSKELQEIREMLLTANIGRNWDSTVERVRMLIDSRGNSLDQGMKQEIGKIVTATEALKKAIGM